ncbi:MAG: lytic transglycosylase domain-containing protein [Gemmatimonadota bacterium]
MSGSSTDRRTDDHHTRQPDRRETGEQRADRRLMDDGPPSSGERRRALLARFRQPLIGLGLAGMALPMVQATSQPEAAEASGPDAGLAAKTASAEGGSEEQLVEQIAATRERQERNAQVREAVDKYAIDPDLAEDIYDIAREENIEPRLAFGLVRTESTFDERAVSHVGARGLTQVMPRTAAWLVPGTKTADLYDRQTNLRLGFRYLDQMIDKYKGNVRLALLAYNRGPGTVDKVLKRGGDPDNGYADKVLRG